MNDELLIQLGKEYKLLIEKENGKANVLLLLVLGRWAKHQAIPFIKDHTCCQLCEPCGGCKAHDTLKRLAKDSLENSDEARAEKAL